jgi:uncharacterized damage-inducible protein DinB
MPTITSEQLKRLFNSGHAFAKPEYILADIAAELAIIVPPGAVHSIASHVAHMEWWQRQALHHIQTQASQWQRLEGDEFPKGMTISDWEAVKRDFLQNLEAFKALCDDDQMLERSYVSGKNTVAYVLVDYALHHAYHLGQIVLIRRLLGVWTPALN